MKTIVGAVTATVLLFGIGTQVSHAQSSFSCPWGRQGACLDYGDKVCSTFAKCVDQNAICFNQFTCDYKGFVCKSDLEDLADECEQSRRKYNVLVERYNELLDASNEIKNEVDRLEIEVNNAQQRASCVDYALTLEEAKDCFW